MQKNYCWVKDTFYIQVTMHQHRRFILNIHITCSWCDAEGRAPCPNLMADVMIERNTMTHTYIIKNKKNII